jgi:hypothetical protein
MTPVAGSSLRLESRFRIQLRSNPPAAPEDGGVRVFEEWSGQFRQFLAAFDGRECPSCVVAANAARREIARLGSATPPDAIELCGRHLAPTLEATTDRSWKSRLVRAAIAGRSRALENLSAPCQVCARVAAVEVKLARSVRRLDDRVRFQKGLESAPLFCHRHAAQISAGASARNFVTIQLRKLSQLGDELSQSELRGREAEPLIELALRCFGVHTGEMAAELADLPKAGAGDDSANVENRELAGWDERRRDALIGNLESELAALRYRNGILEQENRRLTLAYNALEMMRRDLEHDRRNLMREQAAAKK